MKIRITEKLISIPPYLSTGWEHITSLQAEPQAEESLLTLVIHLKDGKSFVIPGISKEAVEEIFAAHEKFLEGMPAAHAPTPDTLSKSIHSLFQNLTQLNGAEGAGLSLHIAGLPQVEGIMAAMQHDPSQSQTDPLPAEILEKILLVAKWILPGDMGQFPKPEPHCNCIHCQVARAVHGIAPADGGSTEEEVKDEDLSFRSPWEVVQTGNQLYVVSHPNNPAEQYHVYLGEPIGCTCGASHCEHIEAVLYS